MSDNIAPVLVIPLPTDLTNFDLQTLLDGVTYTLAFRWNIRAAAWFMDILNEDGDTVIVAGIKIVVDFPLNLYRADREPPGILIAQDTLGSGVDPGLGELGDRVQLKYVSAVLLAQLLV